MTKKSKPRLGRGLSALIGDPVAIDRTNTEHAQGVESPASPSIPATTQSRADDAPAEKDGRRLTMALLTEIKPSPHQPREDPSNADLESLAKSIKQSGVMQPIVLRPSDAESGGEPWELIAGERRWRAATLAGLERIPAVVVEIDDRTAAEWALIENIQRKDLNPMERARALRHLRDRFGMTQAEVADHVGLERSSVANLIRLTDLPEDVQSLIASGELTAGHGKALAGMTTPYGGVNKMAQRAIDSGWSVRQLEKAISDISDSSMGDYKPTKQDSTASYAELEKQLGEYLGTNVQIRTSGSGSKGTLKLSFYDVQHFEGMMSKIGFRMDS